RRLSEPPESPFFLLKLLLPPRPTLFPYTTLFRSYWINGKETAEGWIVWTGAHHHQGGKWIREFLPFPDETVRAYHGRVGGDAERSEEHTSELQSRGHLVCRLLLETKNRDRSRARR